MQIMKVCANVGWSWQKQQKHPTGGDNWDPLISHRFEKTWTVGGEDTLEQEMRKSHMTDWIKRQNETKVIFLWLEEKEMMMDKPWLTTTVNTRYFMRIQISFEQLLSVGEKQWWKRIAFTEKPSLGAKSAWAAGVLRDVRKANLKCPMILYAEFFRIKTTRNEWKAPRSTMGQVWIVEKRTTTNKKNTRILHKIAAVEQMWVPHLNNMEKRKHIKKTAALTDSRLKSAIKWKTLKMDRQN